MATEQRLAALYGFLGGVAGGIAILLVLAGWLGWQWRRHGP